MNEATSGFSTFGMRSLLAIAKRHLDAVDRSRVTDNHVIGVDNWEQLYVSTVFSAMAVEAGVNDFLLHHCMVLQPPYLQLFFGTVVRDYLFSPIHKKIAALRRCLPDRFSAEQLKDVNEMFRIRNRIAHQASEFTPAGGGEDQWATMTESGLQPAEMLHMLRHIDIARAFLSQLSFPDDADL